MPGFANAHHRKRRTREHIIADLAINFVERFALESGFVVEERTKSDYGYDLTLTTFDERGYVEQGAVNLQLKATDALARYELDSDTLSLSIDIRDWNLWSSDPAPVFLILYDAIRRRAYWEYVQAYFAGQPAPEGRCQKRNYSYSEEKPASSQYNVLDAEEKDCPCTAGQKGCSTWLSR